MLIKLAKKRSPKKENCVNLRPTKTYPSGMSETGVKMFKDYIVSKMGFIPCTMDGDMYYRRNMREGEPYYELLLVYVDDVLAISHDPEAIMKTIGLGFVIKDDECCFAPFLKKTSE